LFLPLPQPSQAVSTTKHVRPLSPHLQVYRPQITMVMSILHRITGVVLAFGAFVVAWWLLSIAAGPDAYASFRECAASIPGRIVLAGFAFCLIYHLLNGIRHLLWDIGYGYEIPKLYATGWTVVVLTTVFTALLWVLALRAGGSL
jgi:succinate dehydrogenase / fumarate reductase cytochrome b subunit